MDKQIEAANKYYKDVNTNVMVMARMLHTKVKNVDSERLCSRLNILINSTPLYIIENSDYIWKYKDVIFFDIYDEKTETYDWSPLDRDYEELSALSPEMLSMFNMIRDTIKKASEEERIELYDTLCGLLQTIALYRKHYKGTEYQ